MRPFWNSPSGRSRSQMRTFEPRTANSRRSCAWLNSASSRLRSEISWTIAMQKAGCAAASRCTDAVTCVQTLAPSLRNNRLKGLSNQFRARVAEDFAQLLVGAQATVLAVHVGDSDGRVFERAAEPLLTFPQILLGLFEVVDVDDAARRANGSPLGVPDQHAPNERPVIGPVPVLDSMDGLEFFDFASQKRLAVARHLVPVF